MYANLIKKELNQSRRLYGLIRRVISIESCKLQSAHDNGATIAATYRENFASRHIGVNEKVEIDMLKTLNVKVSSIKCCFNFNQLLKLYEFFLIVSDVGRADCENRTEEHIS